MSLQYKDTLFHGTISEIENVDVTDDTLLCLRSYWDGLYGSTGSRDAKEILLRNLEPDNLGTQYYIGNQEAVQKLIVGFTEVERG
ncbi:MAG: hypothetical protein IJ683_01010 [Butyrivibrio sp.]|nr:hypothetical protein [Butyrivibrio sp.]MBR1640899.1 hypothetical protein [Butyrivibrio sp.]